MLFKNSTNNLIYPAINKATNAAMQIKRIALSPVWLITLNDFFIKCFAVTLYPCKVINCFKKEIRDLQLLFLYELAQLLSFNFVINKQKQKVFKERFRFWA